MLKLVLFLILAAVPAMVSPGAAFAGETAVTVPEKVPCQVCSMHGAGHGEEKVKAHTVYEGAVYTFCAESCKEAFDADPVAYLPPSYPTPAPAFTVSDFDGRTASLEDFRGHWLLLDFWATWCQPCVKLMPELDRIQARFAEAGLVVLGVSVDEDADKARKFAEKRGVSYPLAIDDPEDPAWNRFLVKVVPTAFLIDPQGNIVARWTGAWDHEAAAAVIEDALR